MPGQMRPNKKAAKIVYEVLETPRVLQQHADKKVDERRLKLWFAGDVPS